MKQTNEINKTTLKTTINQKQHPNLWELQEKQQDFKQSSKSIKLSDNMDYAEFKTVTGNLRKGLFINNRLFKVNPLIKVSIRTIRTIRGF